MVELFGQIKDYQRTLSLNLRINKLIQKDTTDKNALMRNYNNLGYNYNQLEQYENAILYFEKAMELWDKDDSESSITLLTNIGIAHYNLDDYKKSIYFIGRAKKRQDNLDEKNSDKLEHLLATIYLKQKDISNAIISTKEATTIAQKNHHDLLLKDIYYTSALLHAELSEYDEALIYFQKHLQLKDSFALENRFQQQQLLQQQIELERKNNLSYL